MIDKSDNNEIDAIMNNTASPPVKRNKGVGFALFIAFLALFFAAAGIAAGYKHWQRMHERAKQNSATIEVIETNLATKSDSQVLEQLRQEIRENQHQQQTRADAYLAEVRQLHTQTRQFATTVNAQIEQVTDLRAELQQAVQPDAAQEWQIAQIRFLLRLANQQLHLADNQQAARAALEEADQLLSELDTAYVPVRQQLARDLTALNEVTLPDINIISEKINQLVSRLQTITLLRPADMTPVSGADSGLEKESDSGPQDANQRHSLWLDYKQKALDTLDKLVVVEREDSALKTSLSVSARQQLFNLLQLRLENLRSLALKKEQQAYQAQIDFLRQTINEYYTPSQALPLQQALNTLAGIDLQPELPQLSKSLRQLNASQQAARAGSQP